MSARKNKGGGAPKRTIPQRETDYDFISDRYREGWTLTRITKEINRTRPYTLSIKSVCADLEVIRKRWLESSLRDFDSAKAQELAKIDKVEADAREAWMRSLGERVSITRDTDVDGKERTRRTIEKRDGDARWLEVILRCIAQRVDILGLSAAQRMEVSGPNGGPINVFSVPAETLDAIAVARQELEKEASLARN